MFESSEIIKKENSLIKESQVKESSSQFPPLDEKKDISKMQEYRLIRVPNNRRSALKKNWGLLIDLITDQMKLQIRMNVSKGQVELRSSAQTEDVSALQKGSEFVKAFLLGFEIKDAVAILRLDDIYIDSFKVTDVRKLPRGHLSRAIGRIVGKSGKTKFTIENATQTRIVVADQQVHILGSFKNIRVAKTTIVRLVVGAQPGKVYSQMQVVASRNKCRF